MKWEFVHKNVYNNSIIVSLCGFFGSNYDSFKKSYQLVKQKNVLMRNKRK